MTRRIQTRLALALTACVAAACKGGGGSAMGTGAQDSVVQALTRSNALKDSLLAVIFTSDSVLNDIDAKISSVKGLTTGVQPQMAGEQPASSQAEYRRTVAAKVAEVTDQLNAARARIDADSKKIRSLTKDNAALEQNVREWERSAANLSARIDRQQAQIEELQAQVAQLTQEKQVLQDTVSEMTVRENTVYYIIGSKDELKELGIVKLEGGFLAKNWQPGRALQEQKFTRADLRTLAEIPLPKQDQGYRLVSRQDVRYADTTNFHKGKFKGGSVKILEPKEFWAPSKYLILMED